MADAAAMSLTVLATATDVILLASSANSSFALPVMHGHGCENVSAAGPETPLPDEAYFAELSEWEKESDRERVLRYLPIIAAALAPTRREEAPASVLSEHRLPRPLNMWGVELRPVGLSCHRPEPEPEYWRPCRGQQSGQRCLDWPAPRQWTA